MKVFVPESDKFIFFKPGNPGGPYEPKEYNSCGQDGKVITLEDESLYIYYIFLYTF